MKLTPAQYAALVELNKQAHGVLREEAMAAKLKRRGLIDRQILEPREYYVTDAGRERMDEYARSTRT